jgi:hypothetical protein
MCGQRYLGLDLLEVDREVIGVVNSGSKYEIKTLPPQ